MDTNLNNTGRQYQMKIALLVLLFPVTCAFAKTVLIPNSPFEIDCPPDWSVADGNFTNNKEYDPAKGINSPFGHIHIYKRFAKNEDCAIKMTESFYRKLESQKKSPMPFLWSTSSFTTDSGIKGTMAYFGNGKIPSDKIKEKKFYFLYNDSIYCACLEAKDSDHWPLLEKILKQTLKPIKNAQQGGVLKAIHPLNH
ncbi:MAG: hypothetical protein ACFUZC_07410 [Chthoniobacteraceae bacterium]